MHVYLQFYNDGRSCYNEIKNDKLFNRHFLKMEMLILHHHRKRMQGISKKRSFADADLDRYRRFLFLFLVLMITRTYCSHGSR